MSLEPFSGKSTSLAGSGLAFDVMSGNAEAESERLDFYEDFLLTERIRCNPGSFPCKDVPI